MDKQNEVLLNTFVISKRKYRVFYNAGVLVWEAESSKKEAAAALLAATEPSDRPITVLTDCESLISALKTSTNKHPWVQEIQEKAGDTIFMWIPGHCFIPGNNEADKLAKKGRFEPIADNNDEVPGHDARKHVTKMLGHSWNREWANSNLFLGRIKRATGFWEDRKYRREQRAISRLRTGHTRLSHRYGGGGQFHIQCPICEVDNSVEHVLINCPQYHAARVANRIPESIRDALGDNKVTIGRVIKFLKDSKLLHEI